MTTVKRAYNSTRRRDSAAANRTRIASEARALFVRDGFGATTMEAIAAAAGVALPTVYAIYGSKRAILIELLDQMERDADWAGQRAMTGSTGNARADLRAIVDFNVRFFTAGSDIVRAVRSAGQADAEFDELRHEGERRRRAWLEPIVRSWAATNAIADGVTEPEALDIVFTFIGDELYRSFVTDAGWAVERYRSWLYAALERLVFAPEVESK